ncbi:hypothetical protein D8I35_16035 [Corticibacter populi]|uniref:Uncharacterized protein n=1 Tax=Corticibacter populi TaxID=1550736 RepID=A0A3M6QPG1_9BURK|nr:hypothetical protein [Corticibacter populi]RMX04292.1 hypothetical protein D8I35_16035 [Corticibacter populi]RZS33340.1 hypothetical protein EV687_1662 [Corticibacter populi]
MSKSKVNRLTFDAHSVLLFSALVLAGPASASNNAAQRAGSNAATLSSNQPVQVQARAATAIPGTLQAQNKRRQSGDQ